MNSQMARHFLRFTFWQEVFQLMHQVASDAFIVCNLNTLAFLVMGHFRNQRHPCLTHPTIKDRLKEVSDDDGPESFIRGFGTQVFTLNTYTSSLSQPVAANRKSGTRSIRRTLA
jgi:hypothetical protein